MTGRFIPPTASGFPVRPASYSYSQAWRADCIAYTQAQIAAGRSLFAVSQDLGLSDTTIARWFVNAGMVPPTNSVEGERKARIVVEAQALRQQGMTLRAIAAQLHVCEKRLSGWLRKQHSERDDVEPPGKLQRRACLTCRDPFLSEGAHNRMCLYCRTRAAAGSPYEPMAGGSTGRRTPTMRP